MAQRVQRWIEVTPSPFTHEAEGLNLVRSLLPSTLPSAPGRTSSFATGTVSGTRSTCLRPPGRPEPGPASTTGTSSRPTSVSGTRMPDGRRTRRRCWAGPGGITRSSRWRCRWSSGTGSRTAGRTTGATSGRAGGTAAVGGPVACRDRPGLRSEPGRILPGAAHCAVRPGREDAGGTSRVAARTADPRPPGWKAPARVGCPVGIR